MKTYGKYRKSTEGKNILCTNREIMHLCQVNKIRQYMYLLSKYPLLGSFDIFGIPMHTIPGSGNRESCLGPGIIKMANVSLLNHIYQY